MNVSLGSKWDGFVEERVKSGDFQSASEVIREGLRLLEKEELLKRISASSWAEVEAKLLEADRSLKQGQGVDGREVLARLRKRNASRHANE
jgi:antitoxin ParD1/3/4